MMQMLTVRVTATKESYLVSLEAPPKVTETVSSKAESEAGFPSCRPQVTLLQSHESVKCLTPQ